MYNDEVNLSLGQRTWSWLIGLAGSLLSYLARCCRPLRQLETPKLPLPSYSFVSKPERLEGQPHETLHRFEERNITTDFCYGP